MSPLLVTAIFILLLLKSFAQNVFVLYLLQFNEYRLDRFLGYLRRHYGSLMQAWPFITLLAPISPHKLPRLTTKATIVMFLTLLLHVAIFVFALNVFEFAILLILITPIVQLIALLLTFPVEWVTRQITYARARSKIGQFKARGLKVIGITGSYGKSTTKYFVAHVLSSQYKVLTTEGSVNTPLALSQHILNKLNEKHEVFVVEMGAYKQGEIAQLSSVTQPDIGIITGISNQHIELFGSQENIIKGKSELLESLPERGIAIINDTSEFKPIIPKTNLEVFYYDTPGHRQKHEKSLKNTSVAEFLKINIEPALILADHFKIPQKKVDKSIATLPLPPKTMEVRTGRNGSIVIDDSFSSNEKGSLAAIEELALRDEPEKIVVMTCLIELGKKSEEVHEKIGKVLAKNKVFTIVTTSEYFSNIKKQFTTSQGSEESRCVLQTNPNDTISWLKKNLGENTVILIEGKVNPRIINFIRS